MPLVVAEFAHLDVVSSTMQNCLDGLADEGSVEKMKHVNDRVTYQRRREGDRAVEE